MKRLLRIFELSKNEQRVVLIIMLILIVFALAGYERRVHRPSAQSAAATEPKMSPSPSTTGDDQPAQSSLKPGIRP
jgi:hypothetical protein